MCQDVSFGTPCLLVRWSFVNSFLNFLHITDSFAIIARCYLEITNVCNLDCVFCPKTRRSKGRLTLEQFDVLTDRLVGKVRFLYFHLMGEPLLHPQLPEFISKARQKGFIPVLTTNGTLLSKADRVLKACPHKVQISLHSHEGNGREDIEVYVEEIMHFAQQAAAQGIIVVLRLWNQGGFNSENEYLEKLMSQYLLSLGFHVMMVGNWPTLSIWNMIACLNGRMKNLYTSVFFRNLMNLRKPS